MFKWIENFILISGKGGWGGVKLGEVVPPVNPGGGVEAFQPPRTPPCVRPLGDIIKDIKSCSNIFLIES